MAFRRPTSVVVLLQRVGVADAELLLLVGAEVGGGGLNGRSPQASTLPTLETER